MVLTEAYQEACQIRNLPLLGVSPFKSHARSRMYMQDQRQPGMDGTTVQKYILFKNEGGGRIVFLLW